MVTVVLILCTVRFFSVVSSVSGCLPFVCVCRSPPVFLVSGVPSCVPRLCGSLLCSSSLAFLRFCVSPLWWFCSPGNLTVAQTTQIRANPQSSFRLWTVSLSEHSASGLQLDFFLSALPCLSGQRSLTRPMYINTPSVRAPAPYLTSRVPACLTGFLLSHVCVLGIRIDTVDLSCPYTRSYTDTYRPARAGLSLPRLQGAGKRCPPSRGVHGSLVVPSRPPKRRSLSRL